MATKKETVEKNVAKANIFALVRLRVELESMYRSENQTYTLFDNYVGASTLLDIIESGLPGLRSRDAQLTRSNIVTPSAEHQPQ